MRLLPFKRAALDKLKFVFAIGDIKAHAKDITMTLDDMVSAERAKRLSSQGKGYRDRYRVKLTDDDALFVEINANRPERAVWGLKMEYTPSHLRKSQRTKVQEIVNEILGTDARELLGNVALYEVHVAVDFEVDLHDVAIEARGKLSCGAWGKRFDDKNILQTLYFGSSASESQLTAYDKAAELHHQLAKIPGHSAELKRVVKKSDSRGPSLRPVPATEPTICVTRMPPPRPAISAWAAQPTWPSPMPVNRPGRSRPKSL